MSDRRIQELRQRLREARKARKAGVPGENPKKLRNAIRGRAHSNHREGG